MTCSTTACSRCVHLDIPDDVLADLKALAGGISRTHELRAALRALRDFELAEVSVQYSLRGAVPVIELPAAAEKLQAAVEQVVEAPGKATWLPRSREEWYAFLALIVAVLTLMQAEFSKDDTADVEAAARGAVKQLLESAHLDHSEEPNPVILCPGRLPQLMAEPRPERDP